AFLQRNLSVLFLRCMIAIVIHHFSSRDAQDRAIIACEEESVDIIFRHIDVAAKLKCKCRSLCNIWHNKTWNHFSSSRLSRYLGGEAEWPMIPVAKQSILYWSQVTRRGHFFFTKFQIVDFSL